MSREIKYMEKVPMDRPGLYYTLYGQVRSHVGPNMIRKNLSGFDSKEQAYQCLDIWKSQEWDGAPSSPVSFFREVWDGGGCRMNRSINMMLQDLAPTHWIECRGYGHFNGPIYHYDMNRAYYWASQKGYPEKVIPLVEEEGKEKWPHYVSIVDEWGMDDLRLPKNYECDTFVATSELIRDLPISEDYIRNGVSFGDYQVSLDPYFEKLDRILPQEILKRNQQGYWGIWGLDEPIKIKKRSDDEKQKECGEIENHYRNMVYSALTIQRVIRRLWKSAVFNDPIIIYVDACITREPIEEKYLGDDPGDFRLVGKYEDGIFVRAPGVWDRRPTNYRIQDFFRKAGCYLRR